ncbi:MAG: GNAT family N-acetyltransferase [Xanthomonadales bacterium]|nr:GNAT family N-acetyltransferase [Xanthomonadales bacterium]
MSLTAPQSLDSAHLLDKFACGEQLLDDWLKRRALANQLNGASRTFVVANASNDVVGFYTLAAGSVTRGIATGNVRRNMPEPIPVIVLGRLAVALSYQGQRLGLSMLRDALLRSQAVARQAGVRAMLVHALSENAARFYSAHGFLPSPMEPLTLMLTLPISES